jgi:hypothetical protein
MYVTKTWYYYSLWNVLPLGIGKWDVSPATCIMWEWLENYSIFLFLILEILPVTIKMFCKTDRDTLFGQGTVYSGHSNLQIFLNEYMKNRFVFYDIKCSILNQNSIMKHPLTNLWWLIDHVAKLHVSFQKFRCKFHIYHEVNMTLGLVHVDTRSTHPQRDLPICQSHHLSYIIEEFLNVFKQYIIVPVNFWINFNFRFRKLDAEPKLPSWPCK